MVAKWGNPETQAFVRQYLRWATYGEMKVQVHRHIWPLVNRMLAGFEENGISVSEVTELDDPLRLGFRLPGADVEVVNAMVNVAGFKYDGEKVEYTQSAEAAEAASALLVATEVKEPEPIAADVPRPETRPAPISRDFSDPETIRFIQTLIGRPATGEWATEADSEELSLWQKRNNMVPADGELSEELWQNILPRRVKWLRPGATGREVKVMQAGFAVRGFYTRPITGVWGVDMSNALRKFQHEYHIHPRLRISTPDWEALFGVAQTPA